MKPTLFKPQILARIGTTQLWKLTSNWLILLHDQMEVVDDNQIKGLANQVINANCQFVVPILRDKLPKELDKPEFQVVSLSQSNKLFKV